MHTFSAIHKLSDFEVHGIARKQVSLDAAELLLISQEVEQVLHG